MEHIHDHSSMDHGDHGAHGGQGGHDGHDGHDGGHGGHGMTTNFFLRNISFIFI